MATKIENTLIIIFAMSIKIGWAIHECADCDKKSQETCKIAANDGFSCGVYKIRKEPRQTEVDWEEVAIEADEQVPDVTSNLEVCVPEGLNMTGFEDYPICCVWSKELGCQLLADSYNDLWDCGVCRKNMHITYDGLKPCPCVPISVGSRNVFCGLWHVMIAIYCIYALFKF